MDSEFLLPRIKDLVDSSYTTNKPKFLGFLSPEEFAFTKNYLEKQNVNFSYYGGEHEAQRLMVCCHPMHIENPVFPITALTLFYRVGDVLRHRDFLGSLMGLGIKRETVGDILIEAGRAVVFLKNDIADFVVQNLSTVGRVGVKAQLGFTYPLPETDVMKESSQTVASLRLDCVVSALGSFSRNTACEYIQNGLVSVNSVVASKPTKTISNGDVLSIRHKGKFKIISTDKKTKKDRIILNFNTY